MRGDRDPHALRQLDHFALAASAITAAACHPPTVGATSLPSVGTACTALPFITTAAASAAAPLSSLTPAYAAADAAAISSAQHASICCAIHAADAASSCAPAAHVAATSVAATINTAAIGPHHRRRTGLAGWLAPVANPRTEALRKICPIGLLCCSVPLGAAVGRG